MAGPDPSDRYQVVYSAAVESKLEELADEASVRGDGPEFVAALGEFRRRLPIYPQFGDPQFDLKAQGGCDLLRDHRPARHAIRHP